jgi:hypothetical protein
MNRAVLAMALVGLSLGGFVVEPSRAEDANCQQNYSAWKVQCDMQGKVAYYYCRFRFVPAPGKSEMNWVIWYPTEKDHTFYYYANSKGNYWCRAINELDRRHDKANPLWNVLTNDDTKKPRLNEIPPDAWSGPKHPICPGSDGNGRPGCKMLPPPNPPLELHQKLAGGGS